MGRNIIALGKMTSGRIPRGETIRRNTGRGRVAVGIKTGLALERVTERGRDKHDSVDVLAGRQQAAQTGESAVNVKFEPPCMTRNVPCFDGTALFKKFTSGWSLSTSADISSSKEREPEIDEFRER